MDRHSLTGLIKWEEKMVHLHLDQVDKESVPVNPHFLVLQCHQHCRDTHTHTYIHINPATTAKHKYSPHKPMIS